MARTLVSALTKSPLPAHVEQLYLTDPIADFGAIEGVIVSGGVGEYVYGREDRDFGDMGKRLGEAFRKELDALPWPLPARLRPPRPSDADPFVRGARPGS